MHKRRSFVFILGASLLLGALPGVALAQEEEAVVFPPEGVEWRLQMYEAGPDIGMVDVPEGVEVSLFMSGGDVVGNAGCNSIFGSYQIDAETLSFPVPFGSTLKLCEGPEQEVEDAYLPLLSAVEGWSIGDEGALSLSDVGGAVTLVYSEAPVEITATDVEALMAELSGLQQQIDQAELEIATLTDEFASVNVTKLRNRIAANEDAISEQAETIDRLRGRIRANEDAIAELQATDGRLRDRIKALEESDAAQTERITALEDAVFVPTPASE
ncbi:MAG TPA: META domain-containing protein [Anaerolineae bacterium]|nr:META domain-containing protein [Anaerolineae bacterium]